MPGSNLSVSTIMFVLILVLVVQTFCSFVQTFWLAEVGERSSAQLRQDTYAHLIGLPMTFFSQPRVGELTSRLAADLSLIQGMLIGLIPHSSGNWLCLLVGWCLSSSPPAGSLWSCWQRCRWQLHLPSSSVVGSERFPSQTQDN